MCHAWLQALCSRKAQLRVAFDTISPFMSMPLEEDAPLSQACFYLFMMQACRTSSASNMAVCGITYFPPLLPS